MVNGNVDVLYQHPLSVLSVLNSALTVPLLRPILFQMRGISNLCTWVNINEKLIV
jgi:hypothetical protein